MNKGNGFLRKRTLSTHIFITFHTLQNDEGTEIEVTRYTDGAYFGELALVTHKPRAASIYAIGDVKVAGKIQFI